MSKNVASICKYRKILLKLSGEALKGNDNCGINARKLDFFVDEVISVLDLGVQTAIVIGGGNIFRGLTGIEKNIDRVKGDYMGMLATVINAIALQSVFATKGYKARVLTSTFMEPYAERYTKEKAVEYLNNNDVVIFAGGTGNPFFTTDTTAALRAAEINAEILLKGTNVDGIYNADPKKVKDAVKYDTLAFEEAIDKQLKVMDLTAFAMCMENKIPIIVYDSHKKDNLKKIISGQKIGTLVK